MVSEILQYTQTNWHTEILSLLLWEYFFCWSSFKIQIKVSWFKKNFSIFSSSLCFVWQLNMCSHGREGEEGIKWSTYRIEGFLLFCFKLFQNSFDSLWPNSFNLYVVHLVTLQNHIFLSENSFIFICKFKKKILNCASVKICINVCF